jgi:multiple sugar transport system permease protein
MMFLAGMQAIPQEMYEAAKIDGANVFQRYFFITVPLLRPVIVVTCLLSTIWTANSINFIYVLTKGGPVGATMTSDARLRSRRRRCWWAVRPARGGLGDVLPGFHRAIYF